MTLKAVHSSAPPVQRDRLIDSKETDRISGIKSSQRYALIREGKFPTPIRLSRRCSRWSEAAVLTWVQERIREGAAQ